MTSRMCSAFSPQVSSRKVTHLHMHIPSAFRNSLLKRRSVYKPAASKKSIFQSSLFSSKTDVFSLEEDNKTKNVAFERLLKISNIASLLCVIDCTVLPLVTILLPLLGLSASASTAAWLHELGHQVALYFVLPVGGLATTTNFINHKKKSLLALSLVGLSCVYMANAHGGPILSMLPHKLAHDLHCGTILHRTTNILGCACLLSSNYLGKRVEGGGCKDKNCDIDHGSSNRISVNMFQNTEESLKDIEQSCGCNPDRVVVWERSNSADGKIRVTR